MAHDVRGHGRDILGDQPGIEPIVLGEGAASAGELPKSVGIDATHRQAGGEQGAEDAALVAAARLEPNGGDGAVRAAARSACSSLPRRWRPRSLCPAAAATRQAGPATHRFHRSTALSSSRPFLADAGSSPGNCAGMEETTGAPSSFAALSPRRLRASSRDGGGVVNRPPSPLTMLLSRHTRRRAFIAGLMGATVALPVPVWSQPGKVYRVSFLSYRGCSASLDPNGAFREGLREAGYVEGKNLLLECRDAPGRVDRFPELALELVRLKRLLDEAPPA